MNRKKVLTLFTALSLTAVVGAGATLAYFTDKAETENVITMGNVNITLTEPEFDQEDGECDNSISNVMPGQVIAKDPTITLGEDSLDAYIRVKLEVTGFEDIEDGDDYAEAILEGLDIQDGWKKVGDYYYYENVLTNNEANADSATLFTEVTIPTEWNNTVANVEFRINVVAEAVQADNLADGFFDEETGAWTIDADSIIEYNEVED